MTPNTLDASSAQPNLIVREAQLMALGRLWDHANGFSGQCRKTAAMLLSIYNGNRFQMDLTDFRGLDELLLEDCLQVLRLDYRAAAEIHKLLGVPGKAFEKLAAGWEIVECVDFTDKSW